MIVHNEETVNGALQVLEASPQGVRYSDQFAYIIITTPETLELQCRRALARNDIAIIAPLGHEGEMEVYATVLPGIRKKRAEEEKKNVKEWLKEHPEQVERIEKRLK